MKITLIHKIQQPNQLGECEVYFRIRDKKGDVKISTNIFLLPKDFKNGNLKVSHPKFNSHNITLLKIRKDLDYIINNLKEEDENFTPKMVKIRYNELTSDREDDKVELLDFWNGYEEYLETKKLKSYGYLKTIKTLENHLRNFEIHNGRRITYDWIVKKTNLFQTDFNDYLWNVKGFLILMLINFMII